jgi:hypothetical protein
LLTGAAWLANLHNKTKVETFADAETEALK